MKHAMDFGIKTQITNMEYEQKSDTPEEIKDMLREHLAQVLIDNKEFNTLTKTSERPMEDLKEIESHVYTVSSFLFKVLNNLGVEGIEKLLQCDTKRLLDYLYSETDS